MPINSMLKLFVAGPALGIILFMAAHNYCSSEKSSLQEQHRNETVRIKEEWRKKLFAQQQSGQKLLLSKQMEVKEKWEAALGGPTEIASKDPTLSIIKMIEATSKACAPYGTKAGVSVDRFTEFTLTLELPGAPNRGQMAETAACVLHHCGIYLQKIRFAQSGDVLAQIGPEGLSRISDWESLQAATVESLLENTDAQPRALAANLQKSRGPTSEISDLLPEQETAKKAAEQFYKLLQTHYKNCTAAIGTQDSAARLSTLRDVREMGERLRSLEAADDSLKNAKAFFAHPEEAFETLLRSGNVDSLLIKVTLRGYEQSAREKNATLLSMCMTVGDRQLAAKNLLEAMSKFAGQWTPMADGIHISFQNREVEAVYRRVAADYEQTTAALTKAFELMGETDPKK
jgi:hypothetical protein